MPGLVSFTGTVPANYDKYLGPYLFEPYAIDITSRLAADNCTNVLEIASGTGRLTKHLVKLLPPGGRLIATDLNEDMLKVARQVVSDERIEWHTADAQALPFSNNSFHHVVCQFGVMFFPDKPLAFAEAARVLQPKGKFIFNTWGPVEKNTRAYFVQQLVLDTFAGDAPEFFAKGPYAFHDHALITQLMTNAGFTNITIEEVPKTCFYDRKETYINGFTLGSTLSVFLDAQPEGTRQKLQEEAMRRLAHRQEPLEELMLALVVSGVKG